MKKIWRRLTGMLMLVSFLVTTFSAGALAAVPVEKHETVYVITDACGEAQEVIVSDWLENHDGAQVLEDHSNLTGIEVVKGAAIQTGSSEDLSWATDGQDVYYQGNTVQDLPVDAVITYLLDGSPIAPETLAGKSGRLTIQIRYENRTGASVRVDGVRETMAVPFLMATGLVLSSDGCKNVAVDHGFIENDGERTIVVAYGFPGLADSLKLSELDGGAQTLELPDHVEITADVTDFSLELAATVADCSLLNDLSLTGDETEQTLEEKLNELEDAASQLQTGAAALAAGVVSLQSGTLGLRSGAQSLDDGAAQLQAGAATLDGNMGALSDGLQDADRGSGDLLGGLSELQTGAGTLVGGMSQLQTGASDLSKGASALQTGARRLAGGAEQLQTGADDLVGGLSQLTGGAAELQTGLEALQSGAQTLRDGIDGGVGQLTSGMTEAAGALGNTIAADQGVRSILEGLLASCDPTADAALSSALSSAIGILDSSVAGQSGVQASLSQGGALQTGAGALQAAADAGIERLQSGLTAVSSGASALQTGLDGVSSGAGELRSGLNNASTGAGQLLGGIDALQTGASALESGLGAASSGAAALHTGLQTASAGAADLKKGLAAAALGATQLKNGMVVLSGGVEALYAGTQALRSGTVSLSDGVQTLRSGAEELSDGMQKFRAEGIGKLVALYRDNIPTLIHRLQALQQLGRDYGAYSGQADGMAATTRFLFRCEAIETGEE